MDEVDYEAYFEKKKQEWEALCVRCGACCGAVEGDPCEHLFVAKDNLYACAIYENRLGEHKTVSGKPMKCVPIEKILHKRWPGDANCGYKNKGLLNISF